MKIITKLRFIDSFSSIFSIKLGGIVKNTEDGKCYQVPKIASTFFSIFHYGGIGALLTLVIFLSLPNIFNCILFTMFISMIIYIFIEFIIILILPYTEIKC